jgi:hypothetical protein
LFFSPKEPTAGGIIWGGRCRHDFSYSRRFQTRYR